METLTTEEIEIQAEIDKGFVYESSDKTCRAWRANRKTLVFEDTSDAESQISLIVRSFTELFDLIQATGKDFRLTVRLDDTIESKRMSIEEFEEQARYLDIINFLHKDEWLVVDDFHLKKGWVLIESNGKKYRVKNEITITYFVEESEWKWK